MKRLVKWGLAAFGLLTVVVVALGVYDGREEQAWGSTMAEAEQAGRAVGKRGGGPAECWKQAAARRAGCWNPLADNCRDAVLGFLTGCTEAAGAGELCDLLSKDASWQCAEPAPEGCLALREEAGAFCSSAGALDKL